MRMSVANLNRTEKDRAKGRKESAIYRQRHPEKFKLALRKAHYKRKYGITLEQYEILCEQQDRKCLLCKVSNVKLHVDHCHTTGKVRGLLCKNCNVTIGYYEKIVNNDELFKKIKMYLCPKN